MSGQPTKCRYSISNNLQLRDVAIATISFFWLSMGYNCSCVIASGMIFDSRGWVFRVKLSDEDIADFEALRHGTLPWQPFFLTF